MKRLIINADDFGLSEGVNRGIEKAISQGIVSSTTVMVNMPKAYEIVNFLKKNPKVGVGIHINLTLGNPINHPLRIRSLVNEDGVFLGGKELLKRAFLGKLKKEEIYLEVKAQIQKFFDWGIIPTHIDSHQRCHLFKDIYPVILEVMREFRINKMRTHRRWFIFNNSRNRRLNLILYYFKHPNRIISYFFSQYRKKKAKNIIFPDWLLSPIGNMNIYQKFKLTLLNLPFGTSELVTHPGYYSKELDKLVKYKEEREEELKILKSNELKEILRRENIKLISFKEL